MNDDLHPTSSRPAPQAEAEITIRIRRRPLREWLAWWIWLVVLAILGEFALSSFAEQEVQAGITAGAIFVSLIVAGLIVWAIQRAEQHSPYRHLPDPDDDRQEA